MAWQGSYFADDAGKIDQYCVRDEQYVRGNDLHTRLYPSQAGGQRHPGNVFYVLVCRVLRGHHLRTCAHGPKANSLDAPQHAVFPRSYRELTEVPGVTPPVQYHSLQVEKNGPIKWRFREFIIFHSEYAYPEYLLAYQRYRGRIGPL